MAEKLRFKLDLIFNPFKLEWAQVASICLAGPCRWKALLATIAALQNHPRTLLGPRLQLLETKLPAGDSCFLGTYPC